MDRTADRSGEDDGHVVVVGQAESRADEPDEDRLQLQLETTEDAGHEVRAGGNHADPASDEIGVLGGKNRGERCPHGLEGGFVGRTILEGSLQRSAASLDLNLEDVLFGRKVPIEGPRRRVRLDDDVIDGDVLEAAIGEESERDCFELADHQLGPLGSELS
ncbi:MAG TPA: hypothetical protein VH986_05395 [Acidimicrobiia bacterium]